MTRTEETTGVGRKEKGTPSILGRVLERMTQGANPGVVVPQAMCLTLLALAAAVPYIQYLLDTAVGLGMLGKETASNVFVTDLLLLVLLLFLSSLVGLSFAPRYRLPGLGLSRKIVHDLPLLVLGGLVLAAVSFVFFDRYFYAVSPGSYPTSPLMLLSLPLKGAFADEVILRLGLLTVAVGLLKHRGAGVILMAALAALMSLRYFQFLGMSLGVNYIMIAHLSLSFAGNLALGYLYVHRGLAHAMILKVVYGCRYLAVVLILAGG